MRGHLNEFWFLGYVSYPQLHILLLLVQWSPKRVTFAPVRYTVGVAMTLLAATNTTSASAICAS